MSRWVLALLLAGCSDFEDEDIVVDLRAIAMTAQPPEQLVDLDPAMPPQPTELLAQLGPTQVCALVADPGADRSLRYELRMCIEGARAEGDRCADDGPQVVLATGTIEDPDLAATAPQLCAIVEPNNDLLGVLLEVLDRDDLAGLGGLDYFVQLRIGGADPALDRYAVKRVRVAPRIPVERTPNTNPALASLTVTLPGEEPVPLPLGRCAETAVPAPILAGVRVRFDPVEQDGAREPYLTPTLNGTIAMFTESLTYQWLGTAGNFTQGSTGGPRDLFGNEAELFTEWTAPSDATGPVDLYLVQRDERLGAHWYQTCVSVTPR